jgi:anti-sigma factor RsiW
MSCARMENKILPYVDGRLKQSEALEMEKHLLACPACSLRVNEFRAVSGLLDELPVIEPSAAFDVRVRARVAAEPAKQSWWAWFAPSPRVAFAASLLLLAMVWLGSRPVEHPVIAEQDLPVVENADYDVISNFAPLSDLSQAPADEDSGDSNAVPPQQM